MILRLQTLPAGLVASLHNTSCSPPTKPSQPGAALSSMMSLSLSLSLSTVVTVAMKMGTASVSQSAEPPSSH